MPSAKVMGTVFWDAEGCILIEFLEPGKNINAAHYVQTLRLHLVLYSFNSRDQWGVATETA